MAGTFVSIGNGTQPFNRLLDAVAAAFDVLPQPVVVQRGRTPFVDRRMNVFDFSDQAGFEARLAACDLFITHGGGGSVFSAIRAGKRAVVVPRRRTHDEIVDDHQVAFARELARMDKIVAVDEVADLPEAVARALGNPTVDPDGFDSAAAVAAVREAVRTYAPGPNDGVLLVTPSGGHLAEIRNLAPAYHDRPHHYVINTPIILDPAMTDRTTLITLSQRDLRFFTNMAEAWSILRRERPRVILTTGGGFSVAFALVGKLVGVPTVYIETVAKVVVPTATGRVMRHLADRIFYQWPQLASFFEPKGQYIGIIA